MDDINKNVAQKKTSTTPYAIRYTVEDRYTEEDHCSEGGEGKYKTFNSFGAVSDYNQKERGRDLVKREIAKENKDLPTYIAALTPQEILDKIPTDNRELLAKELCEVTSKVKDGSQSKEKAEILHQYLGSNANIIRKIDPVTYEFSIDGDHPLNRHLREGLQQRYLPTRANDDSAKCVDLPIKMHSTKTTNVDFAEPKDCSSYERGVNGFVDVMYDRLITEIEAKTPEERYYVPAKVYIDSYVFCKEDKKAELLTRYQGCSSSEIMKIYHARLGLITNEQEVLKLKHSELKQGPISSLSSPNPQALAAVKNSKKVTRQAAFRSSLDKAAYIEALGHGLSGQAADEINAIKDAHYHHTLGSFAEVRATLGPLTAENELLLKDPPSLLETLRELSKEPLSDDQLLYRHGEELQLTDVGNKLPATFEVRTGQQNQEVLALPLAGFQQSTEFQKINEHTTELTRVINNPVVIAITKHPIENIEGRKCYDFLIDQTALGPDALNPSLAKLLTQKLGLTTPQDILGRITANGWFPVNPNGKDGIGESKWEALQKFSVAYHKTYSSATLDLEGFPIPTQLSRSKSLPSFSTSQSNLPSS